nr:MAG TPA: hypothetical protein [Caudoviricetes sp.]
MLGVGAHINRIGLPTLPTSKAPNPSTPAPTTPNPHRADDSFTKALRVG